MYFYQLQHSSKVAWVSCMVPYTSLSTVYASYFKNFENKVFKLRIIPEDSHKRLLFFPNHMPRFLYTGNNQLNLDL